MKIETDTGSGILLAREIKKLGQNNTDDTLKEEQRFWTQRYIHVDNGAWQNS